MRRLGPTGFRVHRVCLGFGVSRVYVVRVGFLSLWSFCSMGFSGGLGVVFRLGAFRRSRL